MLVSAVDSDALPASHITALALLALAGVIFWLGYRLAVARRAWIDWRTTAKAVPKMRKGFFATVRAAVKVTLWSLLALALLTAWVVHDVREQLNR